MENIRKLEYPKENWKTIGKHWKIGKLYGKFENHGKTLKNLKTLRKIGQPLANIGKLENPKENWKTIGKHWKIGKR